MSNSNIIPPHIFITAVKGGANNNTLCLYDGNEIMNTFDTQNNTWSTGTSHTAKNGINSVIDYNGLM